MITHSIVRVNQVTGQKILIPYSMMIFIVGILQQSHNLFIYIRRQRRGHY